MASPPPPPGHSRAVSSGPPPPPPPGGRRDPPRSRSLFVGSSGRSVGPPPPPPGGHSGPPPVPNHLRNSSTSSTLSSPPPPTISAGSTSRSNSTSSSPPPPPPPSHSRNTSTSSQPPPIPSHKRAASTFSTLSSSHSSPPPPPPSSLNSSRGPGHTRSVSSFSSSPPPPPLSSSTRKSPPPPPPSFTARGIISSSSSPPPPPVPAKPLKKAGHTRSASTFARRPNSPFSSSFTPTLAPLTSSSSSSTSSFSSSSFSSSPPPPPPPSSSSSSPSSSSSSPPPVPGLTRSRPTHRYSQSVPSVSMRSGKGPPPPPLPSSFLASAQEEQVRTKDAKNRCTTLLGMALEARDLVSLQEAVDQANQLKLSNPLVRKAKEMLENESSSTSSSSPSSRSTAEVSTLTFYLKQGIELKSRDALKLALSKVDALLDDDQLNQVPQNDSQFMNLVEQARTLSDQLEKEYADTILHFIKSGLNLRNREMLNQALIQASEIPGLLEPNLKQEATQLLQDLNARHLIEFYLKSAIEQEDVQSLQMALGKASTLDMTSPTYPDVDIAKNLLVELTSEKESKVDQVKNLVTDKFNQFRSFLKRSTSSKDSNDVDDRSNRLFGGPLSQAVERSGPDSAGIPQVAQQCMQYITANGLSEQGLFRISGDKEAIDFVISMFEAGENKVDFPEVHVATGVLKQYIRMLPQPLMPFSMYDRFIKAGQIKDVDTRVEKLTSLVAEIPSLEANFLRRLTIFLVNVSQYEEDNKMTPANLAIVFAPNILRPKVETASTLYDMQTCIQVMTTCIMHAETIFG